MRREIAETVIARSRGLCERCRTARGEHLHHRLTRARGGIDHPAVLAHLCAACHRQVHATNVRPWIVDGYMLTDKLTGQTVYVGTDPTLTATFPKSHDCVAVLPSGDAGEADLPRASASPPATMVETIIAEAARHNGCRISAVTSHGRSDAALRARRQVAAVLHRDGWPSTHIGRVLHRDHSTILHGLDRVEWDPWMDTVRAPAPPPANVGRPRRRRTRKTPAPSPMPESPGECVDCGGHPMPGALRCIGCFHVWMDATKGPRWGTSKPDPGRDRAGVRQVSLPSRLLRTGNSLQTA